MEELIQTPDASDKSKKFKIIKLVIFLLVILGFGASFGSGYLLNRLVVPGDQLIINTTPKPSASATFAPVSTADPSQIEQPIQVKNGKQYFDDTVILISKAEPHQSITATAARSQLEDDQFNQYTRVSFFDGKSWNRKTQGGTTNSASVHGNALIKNWESKIDPSRVLKESVSGEIAFDSTSIIFSSGELQNEISMRSLPGYTKLMSRSEGELNINGSKYPAYVLYTKIYSMNSNEIQFFDQPFGLTTDWLAFWDKDGNFYHVDKTEVEKPTPIYQTHQIAVWENQQNSVAKTFKVSVSRDNISQPTDYTFTLADPIESSIKIKTLNSLNKAPNNSYKWFMSQVKGNVQNSDGKNIEGIGLVEYIHN